MKTLILLCSFVAVFALHASEPPVANSNPTPSGFERQNIAGWTVFISTAFRQEHPEATTAAIAVLENQFNGILHAVPAPAVACLQRVPLWMTPPPAQGRAVCEYHPNADWLRDHGRDPAMAQAVQISNIAQLPQENIRMPQLVLHELSHGYHDKVLGFDQPDIKAAYEAAKASGSYDHVERWHGNGKPNTFERAYAMTNEKEYFAESSEAYFGRNDFFPFTRDQLQKHDPRMFRVVEDAWNRLHDK